MMNSYGDFSYNYFMEASTVADPSCIVAVLVALSLPIDASFFQPICTAS